MMNGASQRLDKWLWFARLAKTRSLAARLVGGGKVRVNRVPVRKPSRPVRAGDVVTAAVHGRIRVLKVLDPGVRRGPAEEAKTLYEDLSPSVRARRPAPLMGPSPGLRPRGAGRPTKRDRRRIEAWTGQAAEETD